MGMAREMARVIEEERDLREKERRTRRLDRTTNIPHDLAGIETEDAEGQDGRDGRVGIRRGGGVEERVLGGGLGRI